MSATTEANPAPEPSATKGPRRIVALGGGTGMPGVLRGLRQLARNGGAELTAVVTMSDDGGSSGRLRRSMGLPPPGDVRNCLVALSEDQELLAGLFQHRYGGSAELGGHSVGNLILAALAEQTGSFLKAVEVSSRVLRTLGRILPSTLDDVALEATLEDGSHVIGETSIAACGRRIRRISLRPATARPTPGVVEAILAADLVVLGPGSLHTSLLPNIVVDGVGRALHDAGAARVLVANLVSERGETAGLGLADHVELVERHAGYRIVDAVLVNDAPIDPGVLQRYRDEGAAPLSWPGTAGANGRLVLRRHLLATSDKLRHDPAATAAGLVELWGRLVGGARASVGDRR